MAATLAEKERKALIRQAVALREQDLSYEVIGDEIGVSSTAVSNWLRFHTSRTCVDCKTTLVGPAVDDRCGFCRIEIVEWLAGSLGQRERAISKLRGSGFSKQAIASALAAAGEREPVEEILELLLGGAERVGVAA